MDTIQTEKEYYDAIAILQSVFRAGEKNKWFNKAHEIANLILDYERKQREVFKQAS